MDRWPFGLRTLDLIRHLESGGSVPPIHVKPNGSGQYIILDGRHRVLAHKMLERPFIEVRYGVKETKAVEAPKSPHPSASWWPVWD